MIKFVQTKGCYAENKTNTRSPKKLIGRWGKKLGSKNGSKEKRRIEIDKNDMEKLQKIKFSAFPGTNFTCTNDIHSSQFKNSVLLSVDINLLHVIKYRKITMILSSQ